jgi:pyruvate formate-lyase activating enzyme-like uncharacterized protein
MKTPYSSYCLNSLPEGCKYCVKGEKLVLFISGVCKRNCYYCSLSKKRKNKDIVYCNERIIKSPKQAIQEAVESNATSAGITGGDPLLFLSRTIKYAKALKQKFSNKFHIHIYLPTQNLSKQKLKKLSKYIDEARFHPEFLINKNSANQDINKIKIAGFFWNRKNIGIELPMIPEKKQEILDFILKIQDYIGFVNLNELEISETNFNYMTKHYKFNETGYVIKNSKPAGLWLLNQLKTNLLKKGLNQNLKIHFCTADLKNQHQYKNRLLRHKILPFGKRTKEGTVVYLTINYKNKKHLNKIKKYLVGKYFIDRQKQRIILSNSLAYNLIKTKKFKIQRIEEFPTFDRLETDVEEIKI